LRYPRGTDLSYHDSAFDGTKDVVCHRKGEDVAIVTYGTLMQNMIDAATMLEDAGIHAGVYRLTTVSPVPIHQLKTELSGYRYVVVAEETCTGSGIKEEIAWHLEDQTVFGLDLGSWYPTHGKLVDLYHHYGLDAASIAEFVQEVMRHGK
jgi:1-deoxy-D-xylulose-5-phosphate synthase